MRRLIVLGLVMLTLVASTGVSAEEAEEEPEVGRWHHKAKFGLNLNQSSFSNNWNGGENGSLSWTALFSASALRRYDNGVDWLSTLDLRFGQLHQQATDDTGERVWQRPEKSDDKIDLETIVRFVHDWPVDPYVSGRWQSEFLNVSDPFKRDLMINPNSFKESAGVAHEFLQREDELILARLGLTLRQNLRRTFLDDTGVGTETQSNISHDGGLEIQADWKLKILKDKVEWVAKLSGYQPFTWSKASDFDDVSADSLAIDGIDAGVKDFTTEFEVGWENTFTTQVTDWIAFNFYLEFVYDKYDNSVVPMVENGRLTNATDVKTAIRKAGQYKQTLSVGLTITF